MESTVVTEVMTETKTEHKHPVQEKRTYELVWRNIILFSFLHLVALYGIYLCFTSAKIFTVIQGMKTYILNLFTLIIQNTEMFEIFSTS